MFFNYKIIIGGWGDGLVGKVRLCKYKDLSFGFKVKVEYSYVCLYSVG